MRRLLMAATLSLALSATLAQPPAGGAASADGPTRLTNVDHLDYLGERVAPPRQAGHTTYRLAQQPDSLPDQPRRNADD